MPKTAMPYRRDGFEDVRPVCEKRRGLVEQCYDVLEREPNAERRERLRWEIEYWKEAIDSARRDNLPFTAVSAEHRLRKFLEREGK